MKEFFLRLLRIVRDALKRFATNHPKNSYEAVVFGAVREAATIYGRRVIVV